MPRQEKRLARHFLWLKLTAVHRPDSRQLLISSPSRFGDVRRVEMKSKIVASALVLTCLGLAACNTVRGAAADAASAANCTESTMKNGRC
jgi:predicted small secreted protein